MRGKIEGLRAAAEEARRAAHKAKCESTREFYGKQANILESLADDLDRLEADTPQRRSIDIARLAA